MHNLLNFYIFYNVSVALLDESLNYRRNFEQEVQGLKHLYNCLLLSSCNKLSQYGVPRFF